MSSTKSGYVVSDKSYRKVKSLLNAALKLLNESAAFDKSATKPEVYQVIMVAKMLQREENKGK